MRSQKLEVRLSYELLELIDQAARASYQSRSAYIRESIALRLNRQHVVNESTEDEFLNKLASFSETDGLDV